MRRFPRAIRLTPYPVYPRRREIVALGRLAVLQWRFQRQIEDRRSRSVLPDAVFLLEFVVDARLSAVNRRTLRKFTSGANATPRDKARSRPAERRSAHSAAFHHHVYVVLLDKAAAKLRRAVKVNPRPDPTKPCVYVGMTGLEPEQRLANHLRGVKASSFVHRYGIRLLPEFYAHLNPMPYDAAVQMEKDLTEDLRRQGYAVLGGH